MNKNFYLHIGFPKTGSSTIQRFLLVNKDVLINKNYYFPQPIMGQNLYHIPHEGHQAMGPGDSSIRFDINNSSYYKNYYLQKIRKNFCKNVILSAEGFVYEDPNMFDDFIQNAKVKIICYLYRYFSFCSSMVKQCEKEGCREDVFKLINYDLCGVNHIQRYIDKFNLNNCKFENYHTHKKDDSLLTSFVNFLDINGTSDFVIPENMNRSPSDAIFMFIHQLSFLALRHQDFRRIRSDLLSVDVSKHDDFKCSLLPKSFFNLDNEKLCQIKRQGELLNEPDWVDETIEEGRRYASMENRDLPCEMQHEIFNKLSNASRDAIVAAYPPAKNSPDNKPILPSMENIPQKFFDILEPLSSRFNVEHKKFVREQEFNVKTREEVQRYKSLLSKLISDKYNFKKIISNYNELCSIFVYAVKKKFSAQSKIALYIYFSGLFDSKWYLSVNPDVAGSAMSPIIHYVLYGEREGRSPTPWFSPFYYLENNEDLYREKDYMNAFYHFIKIGMKEERPF